MFTVGAIFYGDYTNLAQRLLQSFQGYQQVASFRFGLNTVSGATRELVYAFAQAQPVPVTVYEPAVNVGKYPLMRVMVYDSTQDIASKWMWFDDDSYLDVRPDWWEEVERLSATVTQLGAMHLINQRKQQYQVIEKQPWYTGKPVSPLHRFRFATGGWWVIDTGFMTRWDYPFPALYHNGGDSILGELLRQQGAVIGNPRNLFQCHCESCFKNVITPGVVHINVGGRKGRRGIGCIRERYIWEDGVENPEPIQFDWKRWSNQ